MTMKKGKYNRFLVLALFLCIFNSGVNAKKYQSNPNLDNYSKLLIQNSCNSLTDSLYEENLNNELSSELDSLVSTWYVKNAFNLDSLNLIDRSDTLNIEYPDSVYISRLHNLDSFIDLPFNQNIKNIISFYTVKKRSLISILLGLSDYYFPMFEETLAKYDLPLELKYLPVIESSLNPTAISRARAYGLWQFMYGTAKLYGLEINSYVDERFDPLKSTDAACRFLRDLYDLYGDWHLVIAAYNCGPGNVNKAIRRSGGEQNYWDIYYKLPRETRGYIPTFIAAVYAMNYSKEHRLNPVKPSFRIDTDTVKLYAYYNFEQISAILDIPVDELRQFNPQYRRNIIPAKKDKPYILRLPSDKVMAFIDNQTKIYAYDRDKFFPNNQIVVPRGSVAYYDIEGKSKIYYIVRSGDTPGGIANRFHIRLENLRDWNNIRHDRIRIGQKLAIYFPRNGSKSSGVISSSKKSAEHSIEKNNSIRTDNNISQPITREDGNTDNSENYTFYTVKNGDSLYTIAQKFDGVSDVEIRKLNQIKDVRSLIPGQKLKIPVKGNGI